MIYLYIDNAKEKQRYQNFDSYAAWENLSEYPRIELSFFLMLFITIDYLSSWFTLKNSECL